jgi:hypothetical protein
MSCMLGSQHGMVSNPARGWFCIPRGIRFPPLAGDPADKPVPLQQSFAMGQLPRSANSPRFGLLLARRTTELMTTFFVWIRYTCAIQTTGWEVAV